MPSRKNPMPQGSYFYTTTWTKKVDTAFINMLYYQALIGEKQLTPWKPNEIALEYAAAVVNRYANRQWPLEFFRGKLSILHLRFNTFHMILKNKAFTWNEETKRMLGQGDDWKKLIRVCTSYLM
ncbi:UNVERIFIED_CONTAM: hypothetical protein Slati_2650000 [Sesamum latifolium]|uniref:Myb/SANT-like domain-containing protein n=1 Tax=Sesamum latifolium TaxID=2727402 RepID=A0AAW2VYT9_9LAMI